MNETRQSKNHMLNTVICDLSELAEKTQKKDIKNMLFNCVKTCNQYVEFDTIMSDDNSRVKFDNNDAKEYTHQLDNSICELTELMDKTKNEKVKQRLLEILTGICNVRELDIKFAETALSELSDEAKQVNLNFSTLYAILNIGRDRPRSFVLLSAIEIIKLANMMFEQAER